MTRDDIKERKQQTEAFFDAAIKMAEITEKLCDGPLASMDADTVRQRLADLVLGDGNDTNTSEPIMGPA